MSLFLTEKLMKNKVKQLIDQMDDLTQESIESAFDEQSVESTE